MFNQLDDGRQPHRTTPQQSVAGKRPRNDDGISNCYIFKSKLQEYAQKAGVPTPVYETTKEGPSHEPFFRSTVIVNEVRYDSLPGFMNRKAAEQSAAEVALVELAKSGDFYFSTSQPAYGTGLCKNLLQEYAQKMNYAVPSYQCQQYTTRHRGHSFQCCVDIGGMKYIGALAVTKKEAEIKAAGTALLALKDISKDVSERPTENPSLTVIPTRNLVLESQNVVQETSTRPKAKKGRHTKNLMKKRNRRRKARTTVGVHSCDENHAGTDQTRVESQHMSVVETGVAESAPSERVDNDCENADDQPGSESKQICVSEPVVEGMKGGIGESVVERVDDGIKGSIGESRVEGVDEGMKCVVGESVVEGGKEIKEGARGESEVEGVDEGIEGALGGSRVEGVEGVQGEAAVEVGKGALSGSRVEGVEGVQGEAAVEVAKGALIGSAVEGVEGVQGGAAVEAAEGALSRSVVEGVESAPGDVDESVSCSSPTLKNHREAALLAAAVGGEDGVGSGGETPAADFEESNEGRAPGSSTTETA